MTCRPACNKPLLEGPALKRPLATCQYVCTSRLPLVCNVRCTCAAGACSQARAPAKEVVSVCREGFFDVLIQEVASPSEKLPFKHLAVESLAEHLFQLGKHCSRPHCCAGWHTVSTRLLIPFDGKARHWLPCCVAVSLLWSACSLRSTSVATTVACCAAVMTA